MNDLELCICCKSVRTVIRNDKGHPICSACSNARYFERVASGEIIELKIDTTKVKQSTIMQIRAMIKMDVEEAEKLTKDTVK